MGEHTIGYTYDSANKEFLAKNEAGDVVGNIGYTEENECWIITHTEVQPEYRGGDIAQTLVRLVVEAAREAGVKLSATCPYAVKVLARTAEYQDVYAPTD